MLCRALTSPRRVLISIGKQSYGRIGAYGTNGSNLKGRATDGIVRGNGACRKAQRKIRIDLTNLNEAACRVAYITISRAVTDPVAIFTNLDTWSSVWQIPLARECREHLSHHLAHAALTSYPLGSALVQSTSRDACLSS